MNSTPKTLEDRLNEWLKQPGTFVTREQLQFISDMRKARAAGVGYGWMQQVIEWEWQSLGTGARGPEYFNKELAAAREQSPPEGLANADPDDEDVYAKAIKDNDDYVGALCYRGNTVSYMYSKAENYGNHLCEAHSSLGAKRGQTVKDGAKELADKFSAAEKMINDYVRSLLANDKQGALDCTKQMTDFFLNAAKDGK